MKLHIDNIKITACKDKSCALTHYKTMELASEALKDFIAANFTYNSSLTDDFLINDRRSIIAELSQNWTDDDLSAAIADLKLKLVKLEVNFTESKKLSAKLERRRFVALRYSQIKYLKQIDNFINESIAVISAELGSLSSILTDNKVREICAARQLIKTFDGLAMQYTDRQKALFPSIELQQFLYSARMLRIYTLSELANQLKPIQQRLANANEYFKQLNMRHLGLKPNIAAATRNLEQLNQELFTRKALENIGYDSAKCRRLTLADWTEDSDEVIDKAIMHNGIAVEIIKKTGDICVIDTLEAITAPSTIIFSKI